MAPLIEFDGKVEGAAGKFERITRVLTAGSRWML
jgi:hypothetical protein